MLATVKGDVHDIGKKTLLKLFLANNGFDIVNLGINVRSDQLVQQAKEHKPDIIGLSGLLVKSAQQMVLTAEDLKAADIHIPILVGGAALTRKFTETRISPSYEGLVLYASDAMNGLDLANRLQHEEEREKMAQQKAGKAADDCCEGRKGCRNSKGNREASASTSDGSEFYKTRCTS
ncbi:hypothetical protein GCM10020331_039850 [Ectobacillus funiculus]